MSDKRIIDSLEIIKVGLDIESEQEVMNEAIKIVKAKSKFMTEIDKAIEKEKEVLDQFTDDFNHHLWIMRGLQIAKYIVDGGKYEDFAPNNNN